MPPAGNGATSSTSWIFDALSSGVERDQEAARTASEQLMSMHDPSPVRSRLTSAAATAYAPYNGPSSTPLCCSPGSTSTTRPASPKASIGAPPSFSVIAPWVGIDAYGPYAPKPVAWQ